MASLRLAVSVLFIIILIPVAPANKRQKRIVGGRPAAPPPEDDPVVFVYLNDHDAKVYGSRDRPDGYYKFHGIRYAEPPVGRFRFQRPRKLRLMGDVNATSAGPPCPQPGREKNSVIGSEDCLFLNVFTPALPDGNEGLPVVMWIHGGWFRRGSASQYGVRHLMKKNLIVVTIQYRLGSLGFLSAGVKELSGNAGMFDMALCLEWIKNYISFFGGNPNKITVFGQGSGASSALLLSLSEITQGFLRGVLAMSGSALSAFAIDHNPLATGRQLAKQNGCPESPVLEMVKCLQEMSVSKLIRADSDLQELKLAAQGVLAGITGLLGPAPCIEGGNDGRFLPNFLPENPLDGLLAGKFPKIPLLTGVTRDETAPALFGKFRKEILDKNSASPNFLNQFLSGIVGNSNLIGRLFNRTDELIKNVANKYFPINQLNPDAFLKKTIEATGDALFNLPAFQMAKLWSKHVGKTFFYSFDQTSKKKKHGGSEFLHGMPLIEDEGTEGGIGHGDDLPFVFDPEPLYNNTSPSGLTDPDDKKLQNIMTDLIAEFIRTGEPRIISDGQSTPWPAFTEEKSNFVEVTSKPRNHENFRLCQMALWSGIITKLQSSTCQALWGVTKFSEDAIAVIDKSVRQGVEQGIGSIINGTMIANVGQKFNINTILNKTAKPNEGNQGGKVPFLQNILNKTLQNTAETSRPDIQVQEGSSGIITELSDVTASILRPIENESGGDIIVEEKSNVDVEANIVIPVTDAPTTEKPRGVFPFLPIVNRPTLLPRPPLFGKPQLG